MPAPKGHHCYNDGGNGRPKFWTDDKLDEMAAKLNKFIDETDMPLVISFECDNECYDGQLNDLARRNPHHETFCRAYNKLFNKQKTFMMSKGLTKEHDSPLTRFLLSACHGMKETTHVVQEEVKSNVVIDESEVEKADEFEAKKRDFTL